MHMLVVRHFIVLYFVCCPGERSIKPKYIANTSSATAISSTSRFISSVAETFKSCGHVLFICFRIADVSRISRSCGVYAADVSLAVS